MKRDLNFRAYEVLSEARRNFKVWIEGIVLGAVLLLYIVMIVWGIWWAVVLLFIGMMVWGIWHLWMLE